MKSFVLLLTFTFMLVDQGNAITNTTCNGLEELIANRNASILGECTQDTECTQVICPNSTLELFGFVLQFPSSITLLPCYNPQPAVHILITFSLFGELEVVGNFTTNKTERNQTLDILFLNAYLDWIVEYNADNMSLDLEINGTVEGSTYVLYSRTTIPVNISLCSVEEITTTQVVNGSLSTTTDGTATSSPATIPSNGMTTSPPTTSDGESTLSVSSLATTDGTTTASPITTDGSCISLDELIANRNLDVLGNCTRDVACLLVRCEGSPLKDIDGLVLTTTITQLPCNLPQPATNIVTTTKDTTILAGNFTTSTSARHQELTLPRIDFLPINAVLDWTLEYCSENTSLDLQMNGTFQGAHYILFNKTAIPLNTSICSGLDVSTTTQEMVSPGSTTETIDGVTSPTTTNGMTSTMTTTERPAQNPDTTVPVTSASVPMRDGASRVHQVYAGMVLAIVGAALSFLVL